MFLKTRMAKQLIMPLSKIVDKLKGSDEKKEESGENEEAEAEEEHEHEDSEEEDVCQFC